MEKINFKYILFFYICFFINSFAQEYSLTEEEKIWIEEHPLITVTIASDWAPLEFIRNGNPVGFSIDYLDLIAEKVGLKLKYITANSWSSLLEMLKNREIDMAQSIIETPERNEFLDFTKPYLELPSVYYGRVGSERINSVDDLKGRRIAVVVDSVPEEIYKERFKFLNLIEYPTQLEALKGVSRGEADVFAGVLPIANYNINNNLINNLQVIGSRFFPEEGNEEKIRLASRNDWPLLNSILEKGMNRVNEQELSLLANKWQTNISVDDSLGLSSDEKEWLSQHKTIRVSIEANGIPFDFLDQDGNLSGISGEILNEIGALLNVRFVWSGNRNWAEGLEQIRSGKSDIVGAILKTEEREDYLDFTESYYSASDLIFAKVDRIDLSSLEALKGLSVAVIKGDAKIAYFKAEYPSIKIVLAESISEAMKFVADGTADAYIGGIISGNHIITEYRLANIGVVGETGLEAPLRIGTRTDLPLLSSAIKKALNSISEQDKNRIIQKWIATPVSQDADYSFYIEIFSFLVFLIAAVLFWNWRLKKQVDQKSENEIKLTKEIAEEGFIKGQLENKLGWFHSAFENVATGAIVTDNKGNIEIFNAAAEDIFGYKSEEVIGKNVKMLMPENFSREHDSYINNYITTGVKKIIGIGRNVDGLRKNGETFPMHLGVGQIKFADDLSFIGSITDLTNLTNAQNALRKAVEEAEAANAFISNFLAEVSHELRTPLNAIIGFSEIMVNKYFGDLNDQYSEYARYINDSGVHLLELVNDILDITAIDGGKKMIQKELLETDGILDECIVLIKDKATKKGLKISTTIDDDTHAIFADRRSLKQILLNLLTNAVKYTENGGSVTAHIKTENHKIVIIISDTGIGIKPEILPKITEPFTRAKATAYVAEEGWGLGLSICKMLVELHDGEITIESEYGHGTTVKLVFPEPGAE
ncbi:MAG: transporter substrate-binding domain-containing protein [Kordiimonadaceae bacterium]|nr:transporter substrate-binding domain-containing protein [Kordiimonadaceae bacterium]